MKFEIWENKADRTVEFRGSYSESDLLNLNLDSLSKAFLRQPISESTPMADYLLNLEMIFRTQENRQLRLKLEQSNG